MESNGACALYYFMPFFPISLFFSHSFFIHSFNQSCPLCSLWYIYLLHSFIHMRAYTRAIYTCTFNVSDSFSMFQYHLDAKNIGYTLAKLVRHILKRFLLESKRGALPVASFIFYKTLALAFTLTRIHAHSHSAFSFAYHLNYGWKSKYIGYEKDRMRNYTEAHALISQNSMMLCVKCLYVSLINWAFVFFSWKNTTIRWFLFFSSSIRYIDWLANFLAI